MAGNARKITVEFLGNAKDLNRATDQAEKSTSRLGGNLKKVGLIAGGALAAGAVVAGAALFKMAKGAAEDEAAQVRLANQLRNSAKATDGQIAGVEKWISAQGKALGVTDDELRPALSRLVTATGDVGEAQKLASLAMDVSAGTGKSLEAVSTALMKAQNGQVSGLSRLGIATKDANGKTLTFEQATKKMSDTFKGSAEKNAGTLEGKLGRLKLIFGEMQETIGAKLLPVLTKLAGWFVDEGLPALSRFASGLRDALQPALDGIKRVIEKVQPIFDKIGDFMKKNSDVVRAFAIVVGVLAGAIAAVTLATAAFSIALNSTGIPLIIIGIAALTAGLVYAYKRSEQFRSVVHQVGGVLKQLGGWIQTSVLPVMAKLAQFVTGRLIPAVVQIAQKVGQKLKPIFDQLVATFQTQVLPTLRKLLAKFEEWRPTIQKVIMVVVKIIGKVLEFAAVILGKVLPPVIRFAGWLLGKLVPAVATVIGWVVKIIGKVIEFGAALVKGAIKVGEFAIKIKNKIGEAVGYVREIPGKVTSAIGNFATLLYQTGKDLIQGLINGIKNMAGDLVSAIASSVTDKIPGFIKDKLGIHSPSIVLTKLGVNIMEGLVRGIDSHRQRLTSVLSKVVGAVARMNEKIKGLLSKRNDVVSSFKGFSQSVFGQDLSNQETGAPPTVSALIQYQNEQKAKAQKLRDDVRKLTKMGLSKSLIQQMVSSGESGMAQISALAAGSAADVRQLNALNASTQSALGAAGLSAGNALFGDDIAKARKDKAVAVEIAKELRKLLREQSAKTVVEVILDGRVIHTSLVKLKKSKGANLGLA